MTIRRSASFIPKRVTGIEDPIDQIKTAADGAEQRLDATIKGAVRTEIGLPEAFDTAKITIIVDPPSDADCEIIRSAIRKEIMKINDELLT